MRCSLIRLAQATVIFLATASFSHAQSRLAPPRPAAPAVVHHAPFALHAGQRIDYQVLDDKGKPTGTLRYRVMKVDTATTGKKKHRVVVTTAHLKSGIYDNSNLVLHQQDLVIFTRRDSTFTDGLAEINYDGLDSFRGRRLAYTGTPVAWPNQPQVGSALPSGGVVVQVSSPSIDIAEVNTTLTDRKVLAGPTAVTVPAGTFECYAVESQRELATAARADLIIRGGGRQVDYYAPKVGIVKTEFYDKGGKLAQSRVLVKH